MEPIEEFRYLILAAQREGARALTLALAPVGLTPAQAEALSVLADAERPLSVKEIGSRLVCEGGSPSRLMSTLAQKGLVESAVGATDRRTTVLSLTAKGIDAARAVGEAEANLSAALGALLDDGQLATVLPVLRGLVGSLPAGQALACRIADRTPADPPPAFRAAVPRSPAVPPAGDAEPQRWRVSSTAEAAGSDTA
ncbi:MarR family winged helix-turn-helix transcriptional regulator [Conexibacter sp. DBS9H8]|uniref:MarR family winged helix-turn-helix transcriptional regulator n=1 Tax=Conexibacter sp. DBS9H8 TaxID=2937801 RepID=UPI00200D4629|nr:MarR family winged helix-turn-helix transcriptional regulator [Conexibacter sp. DBS9H8]